MASVVDICNVALSAIRAGAITSLEEGGAAARACNINYEAVRDEVLQAHAWNCAAARAVLARQASGPPFGFDYAYTLPPDCLQVRRAVDEAGVDLTVAWLLEGGGLLTDAEAVRITYTARLTDPNLFSPLLRGALAARLAAEIAFSLTGKHSTEQAAWGKYKEKLHQARSRDAGEGGPVVSGALQESGGSWLAGRQS